MPKQQISTTSGAAPIGAYSQGLRVGDFVFVSGQGPLDPQTGKVVGTTIEEQTTRVLENIKAILAAGGASMADVVKVAAHLSDLVAVRALQPRVRELLSGSQADPHDRGQPAARDPGRDRRHRLRREVTV